MIFIFNISFGGDNLENVQVHNNIIETVKLKVAYYVALIICILSQYKHLNNYQTGECKYDAGGYFIINGSEKTVLGQERAAENKIYIFGLPKSTKWTMQAEMKSVPDSKSISPKQFNITINKKIMDLVLDYLYLFQELKFQSCCLYYLEQWVFYLIKKFANI